ncbi:NRDE family protein [Evansella sp. LMS18]|nr:NRDE family protein [Evansella sp. LMS18]
MINEHPDYPFIFASNRDEFYSRETERASEWEGPPGLIAGKDLEKGGTWLGITKSGDFAALTNVREPSADAEGKRSRGELVKSYFENREAFYKNLGQASLYGGFNLIFGNMRQLSYFSNKAERKASLTNGIHALSNAALNTPWPKVEHLKAGMKELVSVKSSSELEENLFSLLKADQVFPDDQLPDTGVGTELEKMLSPLFISSDQYGTRSSTVILVDKNLNCTFVERSYVPSSGEKRFTFKIG